jgi:hypothetical protein
MAILVLGTYFRNETKANDAPWTIDYALNLTSFAPEKPPHQLGTFIFMYAAGNNSFGVRDFLIQSAKPKFCIVSAKNYPG